MERYSPQRLLVAVSPFEEGLHEHTHGGQGRTQLVRDEPDEVVFELVEVDLPGDLAQSEDPRDRNEKHQHHADGQRHKGLLLRRAARESPHPENPHALSIRKRGGGQINDGEGIVRAVSGIAEEGAAERTHIHPKVIGQRSLPPERNEAFGEDRLAYLQNQHIALVPADVGVYRVTVYLMVWAP